MSSQSDARRAYVVSKNTAKAIAEREAAKAPKAEKPKAAPKTKAAKGA